PLPSTLSLHDALPIYGHVDHADFIFHLANHDAGLASVLRHPVQDTGRRAHGIRAIEFHAGSGAAHRHGDVAAEHGVFVVGHGKRSEEHTSELQSLTNL